MHFLSDMRNYINCWLLIVVKAEVLKTFWFAVTWAEEYEMTEEALPLYKPKFALKW